MIWNCLASELLLGEVYLANYRLNTIQTALIGRNLQRDGSGPYLPRRNRARPSGVAWQHPHHFWRWFCWVQGHYQDIGHHCDDPHIRVFGQLEVRSTDNWVCPHGQFHAQHDMGYYPNSYYNMLKLFPNGSDFVFQSTALGGMFGGYNGFKFDFVHPTTNFKLAERPVAAGSGYAYDWFAQERDIAAWYSKYECHRGNNLIDKAALRFGVVLQWH
ncbi:hypothetical protein H257_09103 [Aphanomyces astaci]|uniref:Uncharacterized protein n=1 Tax=Aphanomyces astaci TaxID=112090 RepID=W4GD62_APHAT|nr:hypothetical protein H257_09103 [Aphanomyces astaci]ETV77216.1 hypothetical protein H257_09103 [Aphanomyces astaci]|eukprot:XP_009833522.1 hypothetical protein H257_09103 [Aphanomyces astaci]